MENVIDRELMAELDAILADDNEGYDKKSKVRQVKTQAKIADQYGGSKKVIVGVYNADKKVLDFIENRIVFTLEEAIYTRDTQGIQKHEGCYVQAQNMEGVATISGCVYCHCGYIVVDRRTMQLVAIHADDCD